MSKRSQTTIFIIIAVIVIALVGILVFTNESNSIKRTDSGTDFNKVYSFAQDCLKSTAEDAVYYISYTGGYYSIPNDSTEDNIAYFYNGKNLMPSNERVENELVDYINNMVFFCTKNFVDFPDFEVTPGKIETKASMMENKVVFDVKYPLTVSKNNKTEYFEEFNDIEIPARLGLLYNISQEITRENVFNRNAVCINCNLGIAIKNDVFVRIRNSDNTTIYSIVDKNSKIKNNDLVFNFALKYE